MRVTVNPVDSAALGGPVLDIADLSLGVDLAAAERAWVAEHRPRLAVTRVKAEDIALTHALEDLGFRYSECQLLLRRRISRRLDVSDRDHEYFRVEKETDLEGVLRLAATVFVHDRFSMDPRTGADCSRARYETYVRQSFANPTDDVLALRDRDSGEIVAFGTQRRVSPTEAKALLGGVALAHQGTGVGLISDYMGNNYNFERGIRAVTTAVSAINYPILHVHLGHMGYRVTQALTVLRKIYD